MIDYLKQLEAIEDLPVKSKHCVRDAWYETYYDQTFSEWYNYNTLNKNFHYRFMISKNEVIILIDYEMWGETELMKCSGKNTLQAIKNILTKFKKHYNN